AFGSRRMASGDGEIGVRTGASDRVCVALALGALHVERAGGDQIIHRGTVRIHGRIGALSLSDLQEVHANAGEVDGLRGSGTFVGGWHFLEGVLINAESDRDDHKKRKQGAHETSVGASAAVGNGARLGCAQLSHYQWLRAPWPEWATNSVHM